MLHNWALLGNSMPQCLARGMQVHSDIRNLTPMRLPTPPAKSTKLTLPCSSDACTKSRMALINQGAPSCGSPMLIALLGGTKTNVTTAEQKGAEQAVFYARLADAWQTCRCALILLVKARRNAKEPAFSGSDWPSCISGCTFTDANQTSVLPFCRR